MRLIRGGAFCALLLINWAAASCEIASTDRVLAQVLEATDGAVLLESPLDASRPGVPLRTGATIRAGQSIRTNDSARAIVALLPGMVVQLNPGTQLRVEKLLIAKSTHELIYAMRARDARVTLERGSICAATPITVTQDELRIATPSGLLIAPEVTTFFVRVAPDGMRITVSRGELSFAGQPNRPPQTVAAGQYLVWSEEGARAGSAQPEPVDADETAGQEAAAADHLEQIASDAMVHLGNDQRHTRHP